MMRVKTTGLLVIMLVAITTITFSARPAAKIPKELVDFSSLRLQVAGVRLEEEITGHNVTVRVTKKHKLVVITLTGIMPPDCYCIYAPHEFGVFYFKEQETTSSYFTMGPIMIQTITQCCAVRIKGGDWNVDKEDAKYITMHRLAPGPITVEIAAIVPEGVNSCSVIIPSLAQGQATIPTIAETETKQDPAIKVVV